MDSWTLWADYRYLCARLHNWPQSAEDRKSTSFIIQFTCNKVRFDHFWSSMIRNLSAFLCVCFGSLALRTSLSSLPQFKAFKAANVKLLTLWPNKSGSCYAIKCHSRYDITTSRMTFTSRACPVWLHRASRMRQTEMKHTPSCFQKKKTGRESSQ